MRDRHQRLLERAKQIEISPATTRRRDELIAEATDAGLPFEFADLVFDVATETRLDPALGFVVVTAGIGVRELADILPDAEQETQVEAPPPWVNPDVTPVDEAQRERQLRTTFRRLQSLIEDCPSQDAAMEAFVRQPDVGDVAY